MMSVNDSTQDKSAAFDAHRIYAVTEMCRSRIDVDGVVSTATTNTICLDGTSCTKKSSILAMTGYRVTKVQQSHPTYNPDTYFPSLIGYVSAGLEDMCLPQPHYNDRSPLNVLDWYILWHAMEKFLSRFGNVSIDAAQNQEHRAFVDELTDVFTKYRTVYYRQVMNKTVTCIALIDSNIERVDALRSCRNQGSDAYRSKWRFYTQLQNLMYQTLYPDRYIDLAWFDEDTYPTPIVVRGIVDFLNGILVSMSQQPSVRLATFFPQTKLPTLRNDYALNNFNTHVQRSVGRWICKTLVHDMYPSQPKPPAFATYVPKYLYVDNVYNPLTNEKLAPIIPTTLRPLIDVEPMDEFNDDNNNNNDITIEYIDDAEIVFSK